MTKRIKFIYLLLSVAVIATLVGFFTLNKLRTKEKIHYHAGFVVFENGKKIDFSIAKYMYMKPCTLGDKEDESKEDVQLEKAHLHDNVGDVVHIEENDAKWKDLFTNIGYAVDYKKVSAYVNGTLVNNIQDQPIKSGDSLVLFIGSYDKSLLSQAVTKEYIEDKAKKSVSCGD